MRIIGRTLITKGVSGIKKGVALATKGILDYVRKGAQVTGAPFDKFFNIVGIKKLAFELEHLLEGVTSTELIALSEVVGQKAILTEAKYEIEAILAQDLAKAYEFLGRKSFELILQSSLQGTKEFEYSTDKQLEGTKRFAFGLEKELVASRLRDFSLEKSFQGIKNIKMKHEIPITGKRDTTNIWVALDLFSGGE